ncbi:MAG: glycosyltransferase family protein [Ruegeria sp.]|uniref:glycosyltransferase family protein n=1 Tax=Ruegeria sp. TaxID=1879320 RepID=UPI00349EFCA3
MKIMIAVTHLLGTGHLSRALTLGRAFRNAGHAVLLVSGGMPAPQLNNDGLDLLGLPPLRSDGTVFSRLLTESSEVADEAYLHARITALQAAITQFAPDVLITELYPFGRRVLAREFQALLQAAHELTPRPVILSSIRDILAPPSKPSRVEQTEAMVTGFYDGVLVHSDPHSTKLETSWPVSEALAQRLHYTGYVAPPPAEPHPSQAGDGEVLVSAGGGSVGAPIFRATIEAARKITNRRWRLLVGGRDANARIAELRAHVSDAPVEIEPARADFRQMLNHAAASVSMCGYNTTLDLLQSGIPAVLIPFDDGKEVEQGLRAQSLARLPAIEVLKSDDLSPDALAKAIERAIAAGPRTGPDLNFDGAARSVAIAETLLEARR